MNKPETHCVLCGAERIRWVDIALAMQELLPSITGGTRPLVQQALEEIQALRFIVKAADRLHADTSYKWAPDAKDLYIRARAMLGDIP